MELKLRPINIRPSAKLSLHLPVSFIMPCKPSNWLFLVLCSMPFCTSAAAIHSWIDADGITHFSDTPLPADVTDATTVELNEHYPPLLDAETYYYSIANQWQRMHEERDAKR